MKRDEMARRAMIVLMIVFAGVSVVGGILKWTQGDMARAVKGFVAPALLLIPLLLSLVGMKPGYRLYCAVYFFCTLAYGLGTVWALYDTIGWYDKFTHFLSGFLFVQVGFCFYFLLQKKSGNAMRDNAAVSITYAFFFSMFIAVAWEILEFTQFNITGNDSQRHLTTGVFDTMQDIIVCAIGSVMSALSFLLYRIKPRVRLLTPWVVEEFYAMNKDAGQIVEK